MDLLEIKDPKFLKELSIDELNVLCSDLRSFILDTVSKTGGHLSSNLGVVELTVALHYCFNAPEDKILFDVGHQCYSHKILTGRAKQMKNMREFGGISGFQKRVESEYDCFEAGHSSTSLPIALGMATARDMDGLNYNVIPVIGDGSLANGLSLEALNQIGFQSRRMIIIFNDNNMSISRNVGALSNSLNDLRNSVGYNNVKNCVKKMLKHLRSGESIINDIHNVKEKIKNSIIDTNVFGKFGIYYIGPIDGHNMEDLIRAFEVAKTKDVPCVVHCITKKGKGYKFCEEDSVGNWHGVGRFDVETGKFESSSKEDEVSYSKLVSNIVEKQMDKDPNIVCITPAMISGSCLKNIFEKYPTRSFDVGIAEDLAIDFASGLSLQGKKPFISIYSSFMQRAYDQLNHDVSRMKLPMVIGVDRCSIVGEDGETHHGVFDVSLVNSLPNTILCQGKDSQEIASLLNTGFNCDKPFFIRYPRGKIKFNVEDSKIANIEIGTWEKINRIQKPKGFILTYGDDILKIKEELEKNKLNYELINCRYIKPIDEKMLIEIASYKKPIYVYTCDILSGGIGDSILEYYSKNSINADVHVLGIDDEFVTHGSINELKKSLNIDIDSLFKMIKGNK